MVLKFPGEYPSDLENREILNLGPLDPPFCKKSPNQKE